jgi:hypothetical protein
VLPAAFESSLERGAATELNLLTVQPLGCSTAVSERHDFISATIQMWSFAAVLAL